MEQFHSFLTWPLHSTDVIQHIPRALNTVTDQLSRQSRVPVLHRHAMRCPVGNGQRSRHWCRTAGCKRLQLSDWAVLIGRRMRPRPASAANLRMADALSRQSQLPQLHPLVNQLPLRTVEDLPTFWGGLECFYYLPPPRFRRQLA